MEWEVGAYLQDLLHDQQQLIRALYDLAHGMGSDVSVHVEGRELVFRRDSGASVRGFLRLVADPLGVRVSFPRGSELFDPRGRGKGPPGSEKWLLMAHYSELDGYFRRMADQAYTLEG